jgi:uncharacterized Zn finger protein
MARYYEDDWPQYISIGERRRKAQREAAKLGDTSPVVINGTQIAKTFWGKSWCQNLERYSDYANRLPRGRTYVRSGCVVDLNILPGSVDALVTGSRLYEVTVKVAAIPKVRWKAVCNDCAGAIDSLVELLQGRFSKLTMERLCREKTGMFPLPAEMKFHCTCPDSARMCKHVAAVLYGVGARLDERPELLFTLRNVDQRDLVTNAGQQMTGTSVARKLEGENLSEIFEIDIAEVRPKPQRHRGTEKTRVKKS